MTDASDLLWFMISGVTELPPPAANVGDAAASRAIPSADAMYFLNLVMMQFVPPLNFLVAKYINNREYLISDSIG